MPRGCNGEEGMLPAHSSASRRSATSCACRMHLARLDVRDEWEQLEQKWETLKARSGGVLKQARSASSEIGTAGQLLLSEIRQGYERIRNAL